MVVFNVTGREKYEFLTQNLVVLSCKTLLNSVISPNFNEHTKENRVLFMINFTAMNFEKLGLQENT